MLQKSRAKKGGGGAAFFVIYTFLCAPFTVTNTWEKKKNHIKMTYNTVVYKCNML